MTLEPTLEEINELFQLHHIRDEIVMIKKLSGTTSGLVYRLDSQLNNHYILKFDDPDQVRLVSDFLKHHPNSTLMPKVLYTASDHSHLIYSYIKGTTHFNRGQKINWLRVLVHELFNTYSKYPKANIWGRLEYPLLSWKEFNEIGIEEARNNIGDLLTTEDYNFVKSLVNKLFKEEGKQAERYLLHGDTGVHNFVFDNSTLMGVIDPSPMVGPLIYDFLYAFCSSPDDLDINTLFAAFEDLDIEESYMDRSRLMDEVSVQLYCRIGLSKKHHPHDLSEYLEAWEYWKAQIRRTKDDHTDYNAI
ncbi:phosphotransferase [Paenibacillus wynnii]|uniref:Aminoglycoside phosphotransferase domain-containing protein n=1 Tax=Paenibacillus wynnii TaxID=268407 RepID=A0A098M515_9BACL|nr:phosphotransferase [Paenibacillus wynnii]KGE17141.1 hypothetical protein PWYN_21095 [Paenibacillus wynnii]